MNFLEACILRDVAHRIQSAFEHTCLDWRVRQKHTGVLLRSHARPVVRCPESKRSGGDLIYWGLAGVSVKSEDFEERCISVR